MASQYHLKQYRLQAKLTQDGLADLSGVPQSVISRIERQLISPSFDTMLDLKRALNEAGVNCTLDDLVSEYPKALELRPVC